MDKIREILISNMKEGRRRLGYSQIKLAELCDLSQSFIAEIERGNKFPSSKTILRLSEVLELKPYQLFIEEKELLQSDKNEVIKQRLRDLSNRILGNIDEITRKL